MRHQKIRALVLAGLTLALGACSRLTSQSDVGHLDQSSIKVQAAHNPTVNINGVDAEVWGGIATTLNNPSDDLRPGFAEMYNQPGSWAQVQQKTGTVGFFVESFAKPDIDIVKLAQVVNARGLKVETGPMGLSTFVCDGYMGQTGLSGDLTAAYELNEFGLQKWKDAGGDIAYFTLDDPINGVLNDAYGTSPDRNCDYASLGYPDKELFIHNIAKELAKWAVAMHKVFPNAKVGLTEMEGVWQITGLDGTDFEPEAPISFPPTSLESVMRITQAEFAAAGDSLDYFSVDFPSSQVANDGATHPSGPYFVASDNNGNAVQNNYGRIAAAEQMIHALGIKYVAYVNEDPAFNSSAPNLPMNTLQDFAAYPDDVNRAQAQWITDRAGNWLKDVIAHGIVFDAYDVELWSPLPKYALPETTAGTQMNVVLNLVNQVWSYAQVSTQVAEQAAVEAAVAQAAAQQASQAASAAQAVAEASAAQQAADAATAAAEAVAAQAAADAAAQQAAAAAGAAALAAAVSDAADQASAAQIVNNDAAAAQNSAAAATTPSGAAATGTRAVATVYRYVGQAGRHHYSLSSAGLGNDTLEGAAFEVYSQAYDGTVGLYRCSSAWEHFLSVDAGCEGSTIIDQLGWIDQNPGASNSALYRFDLRGDWLETTSADEGNSNGYHHQTLMGYAPNG